MAHVLVASFVQLGLIVGIASCSSTHSMPPPPPDAMPVQQEVKDLPITAIRDLDLLFLVDDSPSMSDKQINLADNFPAFLDALSMQQDGLPSIHIGVATSDMGTQGADGLPPGPPISGSGGCAGVGKDGVLQLFGAAGQVSGGQFVSDIATSDGMRRRNYTGNLTDVFAQMVNAGAGGCAFEQHLAAVKRALDPTNMANQGFLRPSAYLGVIIVADEDDCSVEHASLLADDPTAISTLGALTSFRCTRFGVQCDDGGRTTDAMNQAGSKAGCHPNDSSPYLAAVKDYAAFLRTSKLDPNKVMVAGIAGTVAPFSSIATKSRSPGSRMPSRRARSRWNDARARSMPS